MLGLDLDLFIYVHMYVYVYCIYKPWSQRANNKIGENDHKGRGREGTRECLWHENRTGNKVDRRQAKGSRGEGQIRTKRSDFWAGQHMASVPVSGRQRQVILHEFDASLVYTANQCHSKTPFSKERAVMRLPQQNPLLYMPILKLN